MITEFDGYKLDEKTIDLLGRLDKEQWPDYADKLELPEGFKVAITGRVFVGDKFVVKRPVSYGDKPEKACPTQTLSGRWVVQPVCQVLKGMSDEEHKELESAGVCKMNGWGEVKFAGGGKDCHSGNVGFLKGELVQFDW